MPTKFDFVSPAVELREIDRSQVPQTPEQDGILLIGRARSGPAMKPVRISNLNDFVDIFGNPMDGVRQEDPWRQGNTGAPNYAAYAAQAYLASGVGPVKYVRLLGLQKDTNNKAGWTMGGNPSSTIDENAGAYGLFLMPAASQDTNAVLGAVFYVSGAAVALSGTVANTTSETAVSASTLIKNTGTDCAFTVAISSSAGETLHNINFNDNSGQYIRTVLDTDPTNFFQSKNYANGTDTPYFLGETFDVNIQRGDLLTKGAGEVYGFVAALKDSSNSFDDFQQELTESKSGWFIGVQPAQKYLFRLVSLDAGEEFQKNFYCRVSDLKLATSLQPHATFTLSIIKRGRRDQVIEQFSNLSLDPTDANYISKRIGDLSQTWNPDTQKFDIEGQYNNISNYVRVEVAANLNKSDLPVGYVGPKNPTTVTELSGTQAASSTARLEWIEGSSSIGLGNSAGEFVEGWPTALTASIPWPTFGLTTTGTKNGSDYAATNVFGLRHVKTNRVAHDPSFGDIAIGRVAIAPHMTEGETLANASFVFTLDDIKSGSVATDYFFEEGSYDASGSISYTNGLSGPNGLIDGLKIKQFAAPFFGGADGVDIRYADPFNNDLLDNGADTYPAYSVEQATEMVRDRDFIRYELLAMPGLVEGAALDRIIDVAEERGDCLSVVDINGIYRDAYDNGGTVQNASINTTVTNLNTRQIDSSYACTFYPNVRMRDTLSGNDTVLIAPPSVAAIGAIARSEASSQPWFAPAGFNRGGLSRLGGSRGPVVVGTVEHLTKDDRDVLYSANINPIARFPATGDTVIFGQKTLQQTPSALDRINVRRLMIYLKRRIGDIADTILFDQNLQATWNRFKTRADAVLSEVKSELGITEYRLVLDETTTTPDLIDRNIMYAQIYVKPARAIEFIAIDFIITQTGVEF
jgi:hypothetical protein